MSGIAPARGVVHTSPPRPGRRQCVTSPQEYIMAFTLPPLPYDYSALEPHIDTQTMQIHHDKHHAAYVNNLHAALESHANLQSQSIEDILRNIKDVPEAVRQAVINNGGGHANHTMFWEIMGPNGGGEPTGALADAINKAFGSFADFKAK